MFEGLQDKLGRVFRKLKNRGKLTIDDVNDAMREVRVALIEADVNLKVVREFVNRVKEKATGEEMWKSLTPGQLVVKYVRDELIEIMGSKNFKINLSSQGPTIIMIVGLHGSGKTTTCGKLALSFKNKNHKPLLVACDIYRPAAIHQLKVLGSQIDVPVFSMDPGKSPVEICKNALLKSEKEALDIIIIDTAGRLHVDNELMDELKAVKSNINPQEILLVVDSMTGQEAVNISEKFNNEIGIDGIILTKLDGDSRGGAALSAKFVTGKPIKFAGIGEKMDALEPFYPDRIVSRILGMGDVLGLIEKAESVMDIENAQLLHKKMKTQEFDLEDFLSQMKQIKKMGPLENVLNMIPGFAGNKQLKDAKVDEKEFKHIEAIITSMTTDERRNPKILNASRRRRIAKGSGTDVSQINRLINQFEMSKKMMKQLADLEKGKGLMKLPFFR
jgi:signal recognition particle subunit SRP54